MTETDITIRPSDNYYVVTAAQRSDTMKRWIVGGTASEQLALSILSAQPFEGEAQRKDAPAAATRTWISSAAARRFSNRCAAFLRSSALSAIFRLQKHWMLTAALCSTCFWRLIASTVAFAALRRDAAWILRAT